MSHHKWILHLDIKSSLVPFCINGIRNIKMRYIQFINGGYPVMVESIYHNRLIADRFCDRIGGLQPFIKCIYSIGFGSCKHYHSRTLWIAPGEVPPSVILRVNIWLTAMDQGHESIRCIYQYIGEPAGFLVINIYVHGQAVNMVIHIRLFPCIQRWQNLDLRICSRPCKYHQVIVILRIQDMPDQGLAGEASRHR